MTDPDQPPAGPASSTTTSTAAPEPGTDPVPPSRAAPAPRSAPDANPPAAAARPAATAQPETAAGPADIAQPAVQAATEAATQAASVAAAAATDRAGAMAERAGDAMENAAAASGRVATAFIDRLRNDAEFAADRGATRIEDEVVEKIAGIAARSVPGVHDLGGDTARFFASVKERVGLGEAGNGNRGISVRLDGRTAKIVVTLVVEYGIQVYPVTEQVRANVIGAVESMLDLQITEVNIVVDDVADPVPSGGA